MKVSVSLPDEDVEFLDDYTERLGLASRSAALHKAVRLLRASELGSAYADARSEWTVDGADEDWDSAEGDGLFPNG